MKSMTGYGRALAQFKAHIICLEIASVNKRNLEVVLSGPREWQSFEIHANKRVSSKIDRGRIRISISVESPSNDAQTFNEKNFISDDVENFKSLLENLKLDTKLTPADILNLLKLRNAKESNAFKIDEIFELLDSILDDALNQMLQMKEQEGLALKNDIVKRTSNIGKLTGLIQTESSGMSNEWQKRLLDRLNSSGMNFDLDDDRILKEVALFADKCDISEEITRIESHLEQLAQIIGQPGSIGRKIEFLLQEMGREFNTICAKSTKVSCIQLALDARSELEKIKEQAMNVE